MPKSKTANSSSSGGKAITKPKRPLSGYNLFYRFKRNKVLEANAKNTALSESDAKAIIDGILTASPGLENLPPTHSVYSLSPDAQNEFRAKAIRKAMEGKLFPNENARSRLHRKVHGMGFVEMGRVMRDMWGGIDTFTKDLFCELADVGRVRYRTLLAEYKLKEGEVAAKAIKTGSSSNSTSKSSSPKADCSTKLKGKKEETQLKKNSQRATADEIAEQIRVKVMEHAKDGYNKSKASAAAAAEAPPAMSSSASSSLSGSTTQSEIPPAAAAAQRPQVVQLPINIDQVTPKTVHKPSVVLPSPFISSGANMSASQPNARRVSALSIASLSRRESAMSLSGSMSRRGSMVMTVPTAIGAPEQSLHQRFADQRRVSTDSLPPTMAMSTSHAHQTGNNGYVTPSSVNDLKYQIQAYEQMNNELRNLLNNQMIPPPPLFQQGQQQGQQEVTPTPQMSSNSMGQSSYLDIMNSSSSNNTNNNGSSRNTDIEPEDVVPQGQRKKQDVTNEDFLDFIGKIDDALGNDSYHDDIDIGFGQFHDTNEEDEDDLIAFKKPSSMVFGKPIHDVQTMNAVCPLPVSSYELKNARARMA